MKKCSKCGNEFQAKGNETMCEECARYYRNNPKLLDYQLSFSDKGGNYYTVYVDKEDYIRYLESDNKNMTVASECFPYLKSYTLELLTSSYIG